MTATEPYYVVTYEAVRYIVAAVAALVVVFVIDEFGMFGK